MSFKVMTPLASSEAKMLAAFASDLIGSELARLGMQAEVRAAAHMDGYEFRCTFQYTGCVYIDGDELRAAPSKKMEKLAYELRAIVDAVRSSVREQMSPGGRTPGRDADYSERDE